MEALEIEQRTVYTEPISEESAAECKSFNWYALYVKSRHEFITSSELRRKGVETFLPSIKRLSLWKDRRKLIEFPLFPGYVFVHILPCHQKVFDILNTRGVVTFISLVPGNPTPVSSEEIESLRLLLASGQPIDLFPRLEKGVRVRVRSGALKGAVGTVVNREGQFMFIVNIDILGRSVGVKIYADDIETD